MFVLVERDGNWRRAMLKEMKAIEENETWELFTPKFGKLILERKRLADDVKSKRVS